MCNCYKVNVYRVDISVELANFTKISEKKLLCTFSSLDANLTFPHKNKNVASYIPKFSMFDDPLFSFIYIELNGYVLHLHS